MKKLAILLLLVSVLVLQLASCQEDPPDTGNVDVHETSPYNLSYPSYFPILQVPQDNQITLEGVKLGRSLYYDPLLSKNGPLNGLACASCHLQSKSFSNNAPGTAVIPHLNLAWKTNFLWHGSIEGTLEDAMLFEVRDFFQADINELRNSENYPAMFKAAFGTQEISETQVAYALAQFLRTLVSGNSKYDRYLRREIPLTYSERKGLTLFESEKGDCFHCHALPLSQDNQFHNIGLDSVFEGENRGRFIYSGDSADMGSFMTPSLRNIALTAPYMHDGRYKTLREVIEHYNSKVKDNEYLDPIMTKNGGDGLNLTAAEIDHLIDFLNTLTDTTFLNNPLYSSPF